jgi:hypothetical protein
MGKIANIKNKSPETYPDNSGKPVIHTESAVNTTPVSFGPTPISILPDGPIESGASDARIIVMFSGQIQWSAFSEGGPSASVVSVQIFQGGVPVYGISVAVPATNPFPTTPPAPTPFSMFWETPTDGAYEIDVKATDATVGNIAYAVNGSLVLISTPV